MSACLTKGVCQLPLHPAFCLKAQEGLTCGVPGKKGTRRVVFVGAIGLAFYIISISIVDDLPSVIGSGGPPFLILVGSGNPRYIFNWSVKAPTIASSALVAELRAPWRLVCSSGGEQGEEATSTSVSGKEVIRGHYSFWSGIQYECRWGGIRKSGPWGFCIIPPMAFDPFV